MQVITTVEELEALYGLPGETSLVKELDASGFIDKLTQEYKVK